MKHILTLMMLLIASATFAQVKEINSLADIPDNGRPFVVKAYATWCGPCHRYTPIFNEAAERLDGKVDFYMVDVDNPKARSFIRQYQIKTVPQTIVFSNKKTHASLTGMVDLETLLDFIRQNTSKTKR